MKSSTVEHIAKPFSVPVLTHCIRRAGGIER
jgi:hypothetical protein